MAARQHTEYNHELAIEICETVATNGSGLATLCKRNSHWPHRDTIYKWLRLNKIFADMYTQAKRDQVAALVDDIIEISDDSARDDKHNENGDVSCNSEWVARSRLRVDTRKWIAAKLVPRLYGDNMLARELADEMEEFKKLLESKNIRKSSHGDTKSHDEEESTQE